MKQLLLDAAQLLDDCLAMIYPTEFSAAQLAAAAQRFSEGGGTIARIAKMGDRLRMNAPRQDRSEATYPARGCSPLPPCVLCGRTEYPVEYGPRQNKLPAGSLVGFDNGGQVWICRRCSRDPAALERLETDASLTANSLLDRNDQSNESRERL